MGLTAKQEAFYVYALIDPRDGQTFYIGKGKGRRIKDHEGEARSEKVQNAAKCRRIREIWAAGRDVTRMKLCEGMTERAALDLERFLIDSTPNLTNAVRGHRNPLEVVIMMAEDALLRLKSFDDWLLSMPARMKGVTGLKRLYDDHVWHMLDLLEKCYEQRRLAA